jgi:hypothetical protein
MLIDNCQEHSHWSHQLHPCILHHTNPTSHGKLPFFKEVLDSSCPRKARPWSSRNLTTPTTILKRISYSICDFSSWRTRAYATLYFLFLKSSQLFLALLWKLVGPPTWPLKFSDAFFQFVNPDFVKTSDPKWLALLEDLKRKQWKQNAASFSTLYSNQSYLLYHASRNDRLSGFLG